MPEPATIVEPKPGVDMGRVTVLVAVANIEDQERAQRGEIPPERVRRTTVEALVDTGATFFCLPASVIRELGLKFHRTRETKTVVGLLKFDVYRGAEIEVQGRACTEEVMELPEGRQALLGQVPLEKLDFWVDLKNRRLVGNPEHGGQWLAEVF